MALPIQPTPILDEKETERFAKIVAKNFGKPSYRKPTPKLEIARKRALEKSCLSPSQ